jgi:cold shock CspA family protein
MPSDAVLRMHVAKYVPSGLYGFAEDGDGHRVFFHMGCFQPGREISDVSATSLTGCDGCTCDGAPVPSPPILGEEVDVHLPEGVEFDTGGEEAPRAERVERVNTPQVVWGVVDAFYAARGYGFIVGEDQLSYYLHRSEVLERRMPLKGHRAVFYAGFRQGKPRACHVRICSKVRP